MEIRRDVQNVMIKPTHDCNMNCDYCFVSNLTQKYREQRLDLDTLNEVYRVLSNSAKDIKIIWHGGEPTMVGVQWYKDAIELSYLYSDKSKFSHFLQTNGLLLDDEWFDLSKNFGIDIAVSFDGLFQDFRKKGTKDVVERNIIKMKKTLGHVGCLSVITEKSYEGIVENYKYFRDLGVEVSFNYGINNKYDEFNNYNGIPLENYMREYVRYFKYWLNDRTGFMERSCQTPINHVFGLGSSCCSTSDCRYGWVNVNPDGSTSHCNRYFPEELGMGEIKNFKHIDGLYNTPNYKKFCGLVEERLKNYCLSCDFLPYCKGGCNSLHFMNTGKISNIDLTYCERFKSEFVQVYKILRNVDIYLNNNLNLNFLNILNEGVFTLKEIKDYFLSKGVNVHNLGFDGENLINSKEFRLFRVFNPLRENKGGHVDTFNFSKVRYEDLKNITKSLEFRNKRLRDLDYIFNLRIDSILQILGD